MSAVAEDFPGINAAELFGFYVVTDGTKTESGRFPPEGVYGPYRNNTRQDIDLELFRSPRAGRALKLYLALWEQDGCLGDYVAVALRVLNVANFNLLDFATGALAEDVFSSALSDIVEEGRAEVTCGLDDELGEYEHLWLAADRWGMGTHTVESGDGNVTFNFEIETR